MQSYYAVKDFFFTKVNLSAKSTYMLKFNKYEKAILIGNFLNWLHIWHKTLFEDNIYASKSYEYSLRKV